MALCGDIAMVLAESPSVDININVGLSAKAAGAMMH
jgi:hypothetical protein